mmetsp:Transcript_243/g.551  ORF Transcript_243/g.551 Transcript_243/m.551 type:complete len:416 (-) Transcript_243:461-1708(-)
MPVKVSCQRLCGRARRTKPLRTRLIAERTAATTAIPPTATHQTHASMTGAGSRARAPPAAPAAATPAALEGGPPQPRAICKAPAAAPKTPPAMMRMISSSWNTGWRRSSNSADDRALKRRLSVCSSSKAWLTYTCNGWVSGSNASFRKAPTAAALTSCGTNCGTALSMRASKLCLRRPVAISSINRVDVSTRVARNSENSPDTSGWRFSKRPCITKGPTGVGSTGSKMSLMATQLVMYPTSAPPSGSVQEFGTQIHNSIWMIPRKNPKVSPESTRNLSSLRPAFWKSSPRRTLSRRNALETTARRSSNCSTSTCIFRTAERSTGRKFGLSTAILASPQLASFSMASATAGSRRSAKRIGSRRANASLRLRSFTVMMSTSRLLILVTLQGTMPCQPTAPRGCWGQRFMGMPQNSMG